uniref:hypothetical protein n=1 Tax=Thaumasiovibrio occultus TaxID=1891184 RepID=UPI000B352459|nr:hypothetical protein [Thaumasiovibrio occultus]
MDHPKSSLKGAVGFYTYEFNVWVYAILKWLWPAKWLVVWLVGSLMTKLLLADSGPSAIILAINMPLFIAMSLLVVWLCVGGVLEILFAKEEGKKQKAAVFFVIGLCPLLVLSVGRDTYFIADQSSQIRLLSYVAMIVGVMLGVPILFSRLNLKISSRQLTRCFLFSAAFMFGLLMSETYFPYPETRISEGIKSHCHNTTIESRRGGIGGRTETYDIEECLTVFHYNGQEEMLYLRGYGNDVVIRHGLFDYYRRG